MVRIAVTTRKIFNPNYYESYNAISDDWLNYFALINVEPVLFTDNIKKPISFFNSLKCNGLVLLNGEDTNLKIKKTKFQSGTKRDFIEYNLVKNCISKNLPILGICRGHQFINLYFGGTNQKIKNHVNVNHKIKIIDKKFKKKFNLDTMMVNSFHNLGVLKEELGKKLEPWAVKDNFVEGFYHKEHKILSIMWHPERRKKSNKLELKMIKQFLNNK